MVQTWARRQTTDTVLNNGWRLAVGGWWQLAVGGSWRLSLWPSLRAVLNNKNGVLKDSPGDGCITDYGTACTGQCHATIPNCRGC